IDDTLDKLSGAKYFTSIDLASGYFQVEIAEEDKEKTAFVTPDGHYEFN
ncbi:Retrovirus-related Pol polyprotein from transposon-like protein, partial [Dinothrombium tinctorium]